MTPHDKIGLIIAITLLAALALLFVLKRVHKVLKHKQDKDESFNNFMNNK